jgi:acetolactate synthase-1/3 small subunit
LTLSATGDPGKTASLQQALRKFGIVEIARTGKICLKRGPELLDEQPNVESDDEDAVASGNSNGASTPLQQPDRRMDPNKGRIATSNGSAQAAPASEQKYLQAAAEDGADVYAVQHSNQSGVWEAKNVLDAADDPLSEFEPQTISVEVQDVPGVLNEVTGVLARRGFNVQSLAVGNSEKEGMSRITTVIPVPKDRTETETNKIIKQLEKIIYVQKNGVTNLSQEPFAARELMLIKVQCNPQQRRELLDLADIFHGSVCDVSLTTLTLELQGKEAKMRAFQELLAPYGILEVARTGRVALSRDSRVDTKYLRRFKTSRSRKY